jgi:hypothetical protein
VKKPDFNLCVGPIFTRLDLVATVNRPLTVGSSLASRARSHCNVSVCASQRIIVFSPHASSRPEKKNRQTAIVLNLGRLRPQQQVFGEAVPVSAHRHRVALLVANPFNDFAGRVAKGQRRLRRPCPSYQGPCIQSSPLIPEARLRRRRLDGAVHLLQRQCAAVWAFGPTRPDHLLAAV